MIHFMTLQAVLAEANKHRAPATATVVAITVTTQALWHAGQRQQQPNTGSHGHRDAPRAVQMTLTLVDYRSSTRHSTPAFACAFGKRSTDRLLCCGRGRNSKCGL